MPTIRSLYAAILLVMLGLLSVSFVAFQSISHRTERAYFDPVFDQIDQLEIEDARTALDQAGTAGVSAYLQKLDRLFGGSHYLLDANGIDVVSRVAHKDLLPKPPASKSREQRQNQMLITHHSTDGRYWIVAVAPIDTSHPRMFLPYYLLVAVILILLCWLAAVGIIAPLREMSKTALSFGQGELEARVQTRRQDEVGQLAQSFNQMADRVQRLITSERRLLGDVSHELRSPLSRLKLATKLARTASDRQSALDRIERDVDRMTLLVADILEITRMEGEPSSLEMTPLELGPLLEAIVDDCRIEAETRECDLRVSGHVTNEIDGDRELLRRAIENVVRNAIHYTPVDTSVDIVLTEEPGAATIEVRDRGPGVPEEFLERIFEPFFRTEEARDKLRGGSGLGLSITCRAIQLHQGSVAAVNTAPGLKVVITLPTSRLRRGMC